MSDWYRQPDPPPDRDPFEPFSIEPPEPPGPNKAVTLVAALIAFVALAVGAVLVLGSDDGVEGAGDRPTDGAGGSPAPTTTVPLTVDDAVWPLAGGQVRYRDPVTAARRFAVDFVGFIDPVIDAFRPGPDRAGQVDVRPLQNGPVTTVLLQQLADDDSWWVVGAATDAIEVESPPFNAVLTSPVQLIGRAHAFEGTVAVEVHQDGGRQPIGRASITAGGDRMTSFDDDVIFASPTVDAGALVLTTAGGNDGRVWQATVVRIRFRD